MTDVNLKFAKFLIPRQCVLELNMLHLNRYIQAARRWMSL